MPMKAWLSGQVHASWLIAAVSGGVLLGVIAAAIVPSHIFTDISWLFTALIILVFVFWKRQRYLVFAAIMAGLLIGLWRGSSPQANLNQYQNLMGKNIELTGEVSEDIAHSSGDGMKIKLDHISINGQKLTGQVWLSANAKVNVKRSDKITVSGQMKPGFGNFAASLNRAKITKVERPNYGDVARDVRDSFASATRRAIEEPQASLGVGFLTGQRSSLPNELDQALKMVGLTHVVVASGYNLTILVRFARRLFAKISKYLATATAGGMILGFMLVTGFSPSMSRASLVAGLSLIAWHYGRTIHPVVLLSFVAAITALINPFFVWGDIGWYLSFAAFAGVIMLAPLIHDYFWGMARQPGVIRQILIDTTCAQLATMPIMAFAFGHYSVYALPANLLILPLVPLAMLLTFIAGIGSLLMPSLASIFGWPAEVLLSYMTNVIDWIASQPKAQGTIEFSPLLLGIGYAVVLLIGFVLWRRTRHKFSADNAIE